MVLLATTLAAVLAQIITTPAPRATQSAPATRRHDPFAGLFKSQTFATTPAQPSSANLFVQHARPEAKRDDREIICGMVVVRKSPEFDKGMLIPPHDTHSAVRRIEPQVCRSQTVETAK